MEKRRGREGVEVEDKGECEERKGNGKMRTNQQKNRSVTNRDNTDNLSLCCAVLYVTPNEREKEQDVVRTG